MDPVEDGPVVLEVYCRCCGGARGRRPPIAVVRLRPRDGHRVLHPLPHRRLRQTVLDTVGAGPIDLDDEESEAVRNAKVPPGSHSVESDEGRALLRRLAVRGLEKPWLFCRNGQRQVSADWLRAEAPRQSGQKPRRVHTP